MLKLKLGITILLSILLPISYFSRMLLGSMYSSFFKGYPPSLFIALLLVINLSIAFLLASIFINKTNLTNRLPLEMPGLNFLFFGGLMILLPEVLRVFTSMVEGGGASFTLMQFAAPLVVIAKLAMYFGIIKLLMSVKPHESYVYK